jgi:hypothetical protein
LLASSALKNPAGEPNSSLIHFLASDASVPGLFSSTRSYKTYPEWLMLGKLWEYDEDMV